MTGYLLIIASEVAELAGVPESWVYEQSPTARIATAPLPPLPARRRSGRPRTNAIKKSSHLSGGVEHLAGQEAAAPATRGAGTWYPRER